MFEALPLVVEPPGDVVDVMGAAEHAARIWHLSQPELIRMGANGVLTCGDVILRVSRATAPMTVALRLAEQLAAAGVRVARPARDAAIDAGNGLTVTAWERIHHDPALPVDWERIGAMVARVHALDPASIDHPLPFCGSFPWWDFDTMMHEADGLDDATVSALTLARSTHGWWADQARSGPLVVCHGDVHPGNVLVDREGPVLIDWDLLCVGPRAWDHAPLMTWTRRWGGEPGIYESFSRGYGLRVDDDLAHAIAEMRLLAATLMRLQRARLDPSQRDEAQRRLPYWRGDPDAPMWRAQ